MEALRWSLAHISELLAMNNGFSLAEISENSIEAMIKQLICQDRPHLLKMLMIL